MQGDGETVFRHACKLGLEGIVSKRKNSPYRSGRSPDWLKMKNLDAPAVKREEEEDWGKGRCQNFERKHLVETDRHIGECKNAPCPCAATTHRCAPAASRQNRPYTQ